MMKGEPMPIIVKAGSKPCAAHTPIEVQINWEGQVKADLDRDIALFFGGGGVEGVP